MEDNKNFVKEITNIDENFAQWYTDIVLKSRTCRLYRHKRLYSNKTIWICNLGKYTKLCR